jgi:hypothetical protein
VAQSGRSLCRIFHNASKDAVSKSGCLKNAWRQKGEQNHARDRTNGDHIDQVWVAIDIIDAA